MEQITVNYEDKPCYDIIINKDFSKLPDVFHSLNAGARKICIVTDSTVDPLYREEVEALLKRCCKQVIFYVFPAGEKSKTLDVIYEIYDVLMEHHFDRKDLLVALGGGVVGDMTGYAAATYLRGIRFVQIPTTLLSMVDSSIGGKTGVDYKAYKNMIGAFHQPSAVYMNLSVLSSLTKEQYRSGIGEIVKHALIKNREYYIWLKNHYHEILNQDMEAVQKMIYESLLIKKEVVERDPKEAGERAILNFGHTLGHAIEKQKQFTMLHGDCVSIGVVGAAYISYQRGTISLQELEEIETTLSDFTLPIRTSGIKLEEVLNATRSDKKMDADKIQFILMKAIGHAYIDKNVTEDEMRDALQYVIQ